MELLRSIKAEWPWMPVILYTAWADAADAVRAMESGAEDYLRMPLFIDAILSAVGSATEKYHTSSRSDDSIAPIDIVARVPG